MEVQIPDAPRAAEIFVVAALENSNTIPDGILIEAKGGTVVGAVGTSGPAPLAPRGGMKS